MNVQRSLHPQYHNWGALEQDTEPPTALRAPLHEWLPTAPGVCSRCVCRLQSTNSEYGSPHLAKCHVTFTFKCFICNTYNACLNVKTDCKVLGLYKQNFHNLKSDRIYLDWWKLMHVNRPSENKNMKYKKIKDFKGNTDFGTHWLSLYGQRNKTKSLLLCSAEEQTFGTTRRGVNEDRITIFGWTMPLSWIMVITWFLGHMWKFQLLQ